MTQLNSENVKIFVNDIEFTSFAVFDQLMRCTPEPWTYVPKILGDVKGIVSQEDRQLLKIAKTWNEEQVDIAIEQYILEYKKYTNKSKVYGKESWKTRGS